MGVLVTCDVCGRGVDCANAGSIENYFGSREYKIMKRRCADSEDRAWEMYLCVDCEKRLIRAIRNEACRKEMVSSQTLANKVKRLFGKE